MIHLVEPEPCILDLHIDAVHFGDGPSMDDSAEGAGELQDEFLAAKIDREPALAREGHLKFAIWAEDVRPHALGEEASREVVLLKNVVCCGSCIGRHIHQSRSGCSISNMVNGSHKDEEENVLLGHDC